MRYEIMLHVGQKIHTRSMFRALRTCFKVRMSIPFISSGLFTESKIGFTSGPEYGGPESTLMCNPWFLTFPLDKFVASNEVFGTVNADTVA